MTDRHFNLFYSYDRGSRKDPERISQLEDNITRGLLIVLRSLPQKLQNKFIEQITDSKISKKHYNRKAIYDLQNIDDYQSINELHNNIQNNSIKLFILLLTSGIVPKRDDITETQKYIKSLFSKNDKEKNRIKNEIKNCFKSNEYDVNDDVEINGISINIKYGELLSFYQALGDCRPDAWIYNDKFAILIEAKIGNNVVSKFQVYRHITGKHGFKTQEIDKVEIIRKTWNDIAYELKNLDANKSPVSEKLKNEYLEYLTMTNQILCPYEVRHNPDSRYAQVLLLVDEIQKKINQSQTLSKYKVFLKSEKKYSGFAGRQLGKSASAHYNVHFHSPDCIGINLTLFKPKKLTNEQKNKIVQFFNEKTCNIEIPDGKKVSKQQAELMRYTLSAVNYRTVDKQQTSPTVSTVEFSINIFERVINKTEREKEPDKTILGKFPIIFEDLRRYFKQLDLSYNVEFFDWKKDKNDEKNDIRGLNRELVENPEKIVEKFTEFIDDTIEIADHFGLTS